MSSHDVTAIANFVIHKKFIQRFEHLCPFGVFKILEVKNIDTIRQWGEQKKGEEHTAKTIKMREYAFVGNDNVIYLYSSITNKMRKLLCADSQAIGIYYDDDHHYYYVLTKKLDLLYYNRTTFERRGTFEDAAKIFCLESIASNIYDENNLITLNQSSQYPQANDFYQFEKICARQNMVLKFGKHKTLDFLNLSLNIPLNYHHLSLFSAKFTKALHEFLNNKINKQDIKKHPEMKKRLLKSLNSIIYLNNHLYNSDRSELDYRKQGVSFIKANIGTHQERG